MFVGGIEVRPDKGAIRYDIPRTLAVTPMAERLIEWTLPEWLAQFLTKNRKYASVEQDLGVAGHIPDINRKIGVLKGRIWFGEKVEGESNLEIIDDLIGHLFMMRFTITEEQALDGTASEHDDQYREPGGFHLVRPAAEQES